MNNEYNDGAGHKLLSFLVNWIIPIAVGLFLAFLCERFLVTTVNVDGDSMQPNLENSERVMVWRQSKIKHASVIVFDAHGEDPEATKPNTDYVKRVIGMPGDTVSFKNNQLYVNGKTFNDSFINEDQRTKGTGITPSQENGDWDIHSLAAHWGKDTKSFKVPKGKYFVLGDHRSISNDSRYWGFVPKNKVLGVVKTFAWSTDNQKRHNVNALSY
ncbi:signal peptidase I [Philodulcilactobacillus myokoensis]|uniref:Signal peptidase I n=1 Tax=Philodulcilactobacillus myokoensis TaxID=2929573 RepID=A0A9W6B089_9LACO|nr:signal peptidase I [Philodulcilactobacillus myokoensis]GLB46093.1 signal peptidase I [Philodulcilactobacillus myokoensis]